MNECALGQSQQESELRHLQREAPIEGATGQGTDVVEDDEC